MSAIFSSVVTTVAGNPGTGKTTSTRNMGKSAIIYNVENKELPYPKTPHSPLNYPVTHPTKMLLHLPSVMLRPDVENVVLDSFSDTVDFFKHKTTYEDKKTGFDIYRGYNEMIFALFQLFKNLPNKYVFVLAHSEDFDMPDGKMAFVKVDGNMYQKQVEKFAVVALHTHKSRVQGEDGKNRFNYTFEYDSADYCTKAPMNLFDGELPNDLAVVAERYQKFWGHPNKLEKILAYQNQAYRDEIMDRMNQIKVMYTGPLKIDPTLVEDAFNKAYATLPSILEKVVKPAIAKAQSGAVAVAQPAAAQPAPQATAQPAPQAVPQQPQPAAQPSPTATPSPGPTAPPAQPAPAPVHAVPGIVPGQSISAVEEVLSGL